MNNYFCVLPFYGYEYHLNSPGTHCCLLPKNYDINQLRHDMLNGQRSSYCQACWNIEDKGLTSDRMLKNSALDFYWDKDIKLIEEEAKKGKYSPILIKQVTSNKCNATCVTCSPSASTAWGALFKKNKIINIIPKNSIDPSIVSNLELEKLIGINLIGGEPLWEEQNFELLEKLLSVGNKNCFISFTTNGSTDISDKHKKILDQFNNLNIGLRIDGIGSVFEYMRYPLSWDKLLENLQFFRNITDIISVNNCTSNINVLYYKETYNWCKSENLNFHYNPVINPSYLRPSALPKSVKEKIFDRCGHSNDLDLFIGAPHHEVDDLDFITGMAEITKQDKMKGINIKTYLPDFYELILPFLDPPTYS